MTLSSLYETPSLSERAYEVIKEAILSLKFQPGERLAIGRLADQLNVSRTPVRDALLRLEQEGLVTVIPNRGALVSEISRKDIAELYELRIVLEGYAARIAAPQLTAEDLSRIQEALTAAHRSFEEDDYLAASDVGRAIHDVLVHKVRNERLTAYLNHLDAQYTRVRRFSVRIPGRFEKSFRQHQQILAALKTGDPDDAEQAMVDHLTSIRDDILANIDIWMTFLDNGEYPA